MHTPVVSLSYFLIAGCSPGPPASKPAALPEHGEPAHGAADWLAHIVGLKPNP